MEEKLSLEEIFWAALGPERASLVTAGTAGPQACKRAEAKLQNRKPDSDFGTLPVDYARSTT